MEELHMNNSTLVSNNVVSFIREMPFMFVKSCWIYKNILFQNGE